MQNLTKDLKSAVIRRLRIIPIENPVTACTSRYQFGFCASLADLGYEVVNANEFNDAAMQDWDVINQTLRELKAAHVDHVPLFPDFPDVPRNTLREAFWTDTFYPWLHTLKPSKKGSTLWGMVSLPSWVVFVPNWEPTSTPQIPEAFYAGREEQAQRLNDDIGFLHPLEIVTGEKAIRAAVETYVQNVLYAGSSVKEAIRPDFEKMLSFVGVGCIDPTRITYKENLAYLMKFFWERDDFASVATIVRSPTDILRMFAALTGSDVSLAKKIAFPRLRKAQRRAVLGAISNCQYMVPDLFRYRDLWLAIGRSIHVGEYKNKYPLVATAFEELRNGKFQSWESRIEALVKGGESGALLKELARRPGEFARRLHWAVRTIGDEAIDAFVEVADRVPIKTLIVLERYFETVDGKKTRAFYTKKGRMKVLPNTLPPLTTEQRSRLNAAVTSAVQTRIAGEKEPWTGRKIWIDPALSSYVAPLSQRKASDAFLSAGKGSRIPVDMSKTVRMFCYWKEPACRTTDLDLSAMMLDEDLNALGHVSWTQLSDPDATVVHSGDLMSAELGAVEYLDINVPKLRQSWGSNVRYLTIQILRYSGANFGECEECYAGWMTRTCPEADRKSFDPKTVENAFTLTGKAKYAFPFLLDLVTGEIVYVDLYASNDRFGNAYSSGYTVEGQKLDTLTQAQEVLAMAETRPNLFDLSMHHVKGRGGELVSVEDDAEFKIGLRGCDLNAENIEETLAELL